VGAKTYFIEPVEHDAYVAGISHMPFVLAAGLVNMTASASSWREMSALAATGFRDTTRLASGDVVMHRDIVMTNRIALDRWLTDTIAQLQTFQDAVVRGDEAAISAYFSDAKTARAEWLEQKPGMRPGEADYEDSSAKTSIGSLACRSSGASIDFIAFEAMLAIPASSDADDSSSLSGVIWSSASPALASHNCARNFLRSL
jgi:hypothetical protein